MKKLLLLTVLLVATACGKIELGKRGPQGEPGEGCQVQQVSNGAVITCSGNTTAIVYNGEDGKDLAPGAYAVVEVVDPCGASPGFDEVLLKLGNGQLLAHYAGGGNLQFLTLLTPGAYVTTDSQKCHFSVDVNNNISY